METTDVRFVHIGDVGEAFAEERVAEIALEVIGREFDLGGGDDVAHETGVGFGFFSGFHN